MPSLEYGRNQRVGELIQRELADLIRHLDIDNLGMVTVATVDMSPDLRHARIYVTHMGGSLEKTEVVTALTEAAKFLRHHLSQRIKLRGVPRLSFVYDDSVGEGTRLAALISKVNAESNGA